MLLEFRAKNFKSFQDELIFSMMPAPKQKGLEYSILHEKAGKQVYKGLSSAVIYGSNAAGKTNIISAMDCFKQIVLRGHIRNEEKPASPNIAAYKLELIPNSTLDERQPVGFCVTFVDNGLHVSYALEADLGLFMEESYPRRVTSERLLVNGECVFERGESLDAVNLSVIEASASDALYKSRDSLMEIAAANLANDELFLMNGFKNMFSPKLTGIVADWFKSKFAIMYRADAMDMVNGSLLKKEGALYVSPEITEAAKLFGIGSNFLAYQNRSENEAPILCSLFKIPKKNAAYAIPAEVFESYGTVRFVNLFQLLAAALCKGSTLVIDEFDASIHPMVIMDIVNIFHNDEINIHHAQLIFNTHNPIFLNSNLYRRDEIKFVERDDENHVSTHYSLSDFGTSGPHGVRKGEDYLKNYFVNRYGAIRDIDLSSIFHRIIDAEQTEDRHA